MDLDVITNHAVTNQLCAGFPFALRSLGSDSTYWSAVPLVAYLSTGSIGHTEVTTTIESFVAYVSDGYRCFANATPAMHLR